DPHAVPAVPADVGHHRDVLRVAVAQLRGLLGGGAALHAEPASTEEGEDLPADLRHDVAVPRLVLDRTGLPEAVGDELVVGHGRATGHDLRAAHSRAMSSTVNQT